jgi:ATP-dependent exoDNAse (exonuclease V) beta subunit
MVLHNFLSESGILEHFRPFEGRRVLNEQELTNGTGDLFRADRLVIDEDHVTVIDYKTGREHNEEQYRQQLRNYMRLVSEVLGVQNVWGCIAYVDLKKLLYIDAGTQEGGRTP